jgi:hypothetical protein
MSNRRGYKIIDKLALYDSETTASISEDGYLITTSGGKAKRWLPLGQHVARSEGSGAIRPVVVTGLLRRGATAHNVIANAMICATSCLEGARRL